MSALSSLENRFAELNDTAFLACWKLFGAVYRGAFRGGLALADVTDAERCFLTMEVLRGVPRNDQIEQLATAILAPWHDRAMYFRQNLNDPSAAGAALACELMAVLLQAKLRDTHGDAPLTLFASLSSRGCRLGLTQLQPITWGKTDPRQFIDHQAASTGRVFERSSDADDPEQMRIAMHQRHVTAMLEAGTTQDAILEMYMWAGWPGDAALALVRGSQLLRNIGAINEHQLAGRAALVMLGLAEPLDDSQTLKIAWPPALHQAGIRNTSARRQLNRLAHAVRQGFQRHLTDDEMVSKLTAHGIHRSSAHEFVSFTKRLAETLERGLDYSAMCANGSFSDRTKWLGGELSPAKKEALVKQMVTDADRHQRDGRGYILYLRSFEGDGDLISVSSFYMKLLGRVKVASYEQIVAAPLIEKRGLPFALKSLEEKYDPGRTLPYQLIPRVECSNETWQQDVTGAILTADLVFIRFQSTRNLRWEISRAFELVAPESLLIGLPDAATLPGGKAEAAQIAAHCRLCCGQVLEPTDQWSDGEESWQAALFVAFSPNWTPQLFVGNRSGVLSARITFALNNALDYIGQFA
jgi:hypothetical protein